MSDVGDAVQQAWPPFVLVVGLLLLGRAAAVDGLFEVLGAHLERVRGGGVALLWALLGCVAVTTAVLNLDTAVVFLTPVALHAARRRGLDEQPFLYGTVFMANAASLPLPGSNLTNLLVLEQADATASSYARAIAPSAIAAVAVTAVGVTLMHRRRLVAAPSRDRVPLAEVRLRGALGPLAALAAVLPVLVLEDPAPTVLALGLAVTVAHALRGRTRPADAIRGTAPLATGALFAASVALGTLARSWNAPAELLREASPAATAAVGALSSVLANNLPSAVLLSAVAPPHPEALLVGLDIGPNFAVTGSLSALLWWRGAIATGATPSALAFSRQGAVLSPAAIAVALLAGAA